MLGFIQAVKVCTSSLIHLVFLQLICLPILTSSTLSDGRGTDTPSVAIQVDSAEELLIMSRKPERTRNSRGTIGCRIEQLEPRCMFAGDGVVDYPPLTQHGSQDPPPIEPHDDPPVYNSTWIPMVFAGADASISQLDSLQLSAEVLVNRDSDLTVQWSMVSGPGNATFTDSSSINSSVQFDQEGTYELELTATNNGIIASDRLFVTVNAMNVVNIDQAWLDAQGDGPYYLSAEGYTYILQTDVTTDGTAFAIIADGITFDLNGHTVTYGNAQPVIIPNGSFETGSGGIADGWVFSNAPDATRFDGDYYSNEIYDGEHSLRFATGFSGDQSVLSEGTISLEPNTTYSLSAMFENQGDVTNASSYVKLVGQEGASDYEVRWAQANHRGIQYREAIFTTGENGGTYKIEVGASNPGGNSDFGVFVDDIKIQRNRVYGVSVGAKSWDETNYPGLTQFGDANDSVVINGTLTHGQNYASFAHGIFDRGERTEISGMTITVAGANSSAITGPWATEAHIHHNYLYSNTETITSRDLFDGAVIHKSSGSIHDNVIIGGPHVGILNIGHDGKIFDNQISIRSKYTNGFAIMLYDDQGSEVYGNTIDTVSEDYAGRGIHVQRANSDDENNPTIIRDNTISVRESGSNQEYGGVVSGGAYGIQLEAAQVVLVHGNHVDAIADAGDAYAFRMNVRDDTKTGVEVHDNTFRAIRLNDTVHAGSVRLDDMTEHNELRFENNILVSNYGWFGNCQSLSNLRFVSNILRVEGDGQNFEPVQAMNWGSGEARDERAIKGLVFVDNQYADALAEQLFTTSPIGNYLAQQPTDAASSLTNNYSLTFQVTDGASNPIQGVLVEVSDENGASVFSGTTDVDGNVVAVLPEYSLQGDQKNTAGPYTAVFNHGEITHQLQISVSGTENVPVELSAAPTTLNGPEPMGLESLYSTAFTTALMQPVSGQQTQSPIVATTNLIASQSDTLAAASYLEAFASYADAESLPIQAAEYSNDSKDSPDSKLGQVEPEYVVGALGQLPTLASLESTDTLHANR